MSGQADTSTTRVPVCDHAPVHDGGRTVRGKIGRTLDVVFVSGAIAVALPTVLGLFGRWHWVLDLMAHQRPAYAVLLVGPALWLLARRRWLALVVPLIALVINIGSLAPLWLEGPASPLPDARPLRLVLFNVNTMNQHKDAVARYIEQADADLIAVLETDAAWVRRLEALPGYAPLAARPRDDNFGMMLLARAQTTDRVTVERVAVVEPDAAGYRLPVMEASLRLDGRRVALLVLHAMPPIGAVNAASNRASHAWASRWAQRVARDHDGVIVAGDLNATPFSAELVRLHDETGLRNSQHGHGWSGTWPTPLAHLGLRLPIDHVLHSDTLTTTTRELGPTLGSDHRPVVIDLCWAKTPPTGPR